MKKALFILLLLLAYSPNSFARAWENDLVRRAVLCGEENKPEVISILGRVAADRATRGEDASAVNELHTYITSSKEAVALTPDTLKSRGLTDNEVNKILDDLEVFE